MDDLLAVGVADDLGDLADQVEPGVDAQLVLLLGQEVVEADGQRVVLEDQGRANFVLGEVVGPQDAGVLEGFQELELPQGGPFDRLAVIDRGPAADEVEANATAGVGDLGVHGLPVLVAGAFAHELLQDVVADLAVPLRGSDTGLLHGLADDPGHGAVMDALGHGIEPGAVTSHDGGHDPRAGRLVAFLVLVAETDPQPGVPGQLARKVRGGAEDQGLDERDLALLLERPLPLEQRRQLLGLEVGQD